MYICAVGSVIPLKKAQKIIYALFRIANSKDIKKYNQNMNKQQASLCRIVENTVIM